MQKIGKYLVLETLGRGGMGVVVKAKDPSLGRIVAIKMMTSVFTSDPDFLKRFYREAQSTGSLHHPNIVTVHELGDQDGVPYLVMEFLEGESLDTMISARRELTLLEKISFMVQVCSGLQYAHERHVIHRDIKPANVMVLAGGQVKIVDFGIARMGNDQLTRPGQVIGSIHYMAPEQIRESAVDARCDVFSAGVALYQLLTYELPFHGRDTASTLLKIIQEPPPPLSKYLRDYPPELNEIVDRALAKDPADRYETADEFGVDLMQVQSQLKRELVDSRVNTALECMQSGEFTKSRELLLQALRIDPQHRRANDALRQVHQQSQQRRRGEQARQLRAQAEEAVAQQQYDKALRYLEQALTFEDSEELRARHAEIGDLRVRSDKIREAMRRADAARTVGNFDSALEALEQVLALDPNHADAQAAKAEIVDETNRREHQRQAQTILRDARKHISSRKFTAALEMLQKAQELDPGSANLRELIQLATTGREQEQRRHRVETFAAEIQDALNRDDYAGAYRLADQALQELPSESILLKLRELAERQCSAAERRHWVESQLASARKSFDSGQVAEALSLLEAAAQKCPTDPALHSFLVLVRDTAAQQQLESRKAEIRKKAKDALRRRAYEEAIETLRTGKAQLATDDFDDLIQFAQAELDTYSRQLKVDEAASQAQSLIDAQLFDQAIEFLERTLADLPDEELRLVLADARRRQEEFRQRLAEAADAANRLVSDDKATQAISLLEAQPTWLRDCPEIRDAIENARRKQTWLKEIAAEQEKVRQALMQSKLDTAEEIVNGAIARFGPRPEFTALHETMVSHRAAINYSVVDKAMREAALLARFGSCAAAVERLEGVAAYATTLPPEQRSAFERMRAAAAAEVRGPGGEAPAESAEHPSANVDGPHSQTTPYATWTPRQIPPTQLREPAALAGDKTGTALEMRIAVPGTVAPQPRPGPQLVPTPVPQPSTASAPASAEPDPAADAPTVFGNVIPMAPPASAAPATAPAGPDAPTLFDREVPADTGVSTAEQGATASDYLLTELKAQERRSHAGWYAAIAVLLMALGVGGWLWHNNQAADALKTRSQRVEQILDGSTRMATVHAAVNGSVVVLSGQTDDGAALERLAQALAKVEGVTRVDAREVRIVRPVKTPALPVTLPVAKPSPAVAAPTPSTAETTPPAAPDPRVLDLLSQAKALHDEGQYDEEIQIYDEVLKIDRNNRVARNGKARASKAKKAEEQDQ